MRGGDCGVDNIWSTMTFVTRPVRRKRELNEGQGPRQEKSSGPVWGSWMRSFGLLPSLPHTQTPMIWMNTPAHVYGLNRSPLILEPVFAFRAGVNMRSDSFAGRRCLHVQATRRHSCLR